MKIVSRSIFEPSVTRLQGRIADHSTATFDDTRMQADDFKMGLS